MKMTQDELKGLVGEVLDAKLKELDKPAERKTLIAKVGEEKSESVINQAQFYAKAFGFKTPHGAEVKALTDDIVYTGANGQGGYINAPSDVMAEVARIMKEKSVVARLCTTFNQDRDTVTVPTDTSDLTVTYTDESVAKTSTKPTFTTATLALKKPALTIVVSDEMIQGAVVDIVNYLNTRIAEDFAEDLDYRVLGASASTPYDNISHVSGTTSVTLGGHVADSLTYDKMVEASISIKTGAIAGARWFMHRTVLGNVLTIKDGNGRPIFQMDPTGKAIGTILGFPVELVEKMVTTSSYAASLAIILFGDLKYWYMGVRNPLQIKVSDQASITLDSSLVSCFENNLTAIRAEARRSGALVIPSAFAKIVQA